MEKNENIQTAQNPIIPFAQIFIGAVISLALLSLGFTSGYIYNKKISTNKKPITQLITNTEQPILVPQGAYEIQSCQGQNGRYAEYAQPQAIPHGPIYLTYQKKVVGIEYMIDKDEFLTGKIKELTNIPTIPLNNVIINFIPNGHPGYEKPHYHIDFYLIDPKLEKEFQCDEESTDQASASAIIVPTMIRH